MRLNTIYNEDCLLGMRKLPDNSVDAVVTDPPYHLTQVSRNGSPRTNDPATPFGRTRLGAKGFMGKTWDGGDIAHNSELWCEVYRVLKPGGHLLSFGGSRTYHRMASAIEDAGFEIRDQIMWIYGSGFPKSLDVSKAIDKDAGAKREVVGKNPSWRNPEANRLWRAREGRSDTGTVKAEFVTVPATEAAKQWGGWGTALKPAHEPIVLARKPLSEGTVAANVLKHGTGAINVDGCRIPVNDPQYTKNCSGDRGHSANRSREMNFGMTAGNASSLGRWPANVIFDEEAGALLDEQSGTLTSGAWNGNRNTPKTKDIFGTFESSPESGTTGDSGGASRFFYCAKASQKERGEGNNHPTVKPIKLMEYLVRLITPLGGIVLEPFVGSGTTICACISEDRQYIGFEKDKPYFKIAQKRIAQHSAKLAAAA